ANQSEGGVPAPDGDGEVEGRDDADDAEGVPRLHHAMLCTLGRDGETGELAGEARGKGADVNHLLNFAVAFGENLSGLDGDEAAQGLALGAQLFGKKANEFSSPWCRNGAPLQKRMVRGGDGFGCGGRGDGWNPGDGFAGNGGV